MPIHTSKGTGVIMPEEPMLHQLLGLWRRDGSMHYQLLRMTIGYTDHKVTENVEVSNLIIDASITLI